MITINDTHRLEDYGMKATNDFEDPITFPFSENTNRVARSDKIILINENVEPRPLRIPIRVEGETHLEFEATFNKFKKLFYDDFGKRKEVKIEVDHWQGKFVNAHLGTNLYSDRIRPLAFFTLEFICYDPFKYSKTKADEILWGTEKIYFTSDYEMGHEGSPSSYQVTGSGTQNITVTVSGLAVFPKININGTSGPLLLEANGEQIELPPFTDTRYNIERFKSTRNGQEVFINARRFYLKPGKNTIRVTGNNKNFTLGIEFRDRYN